MNEIKIIEVLKIRRYQLVAVVAAIAMTAVYIYTQLLGNLANIDVWLTVMPWYNKIFFPIFVGIFGITAAYQVYLWKQPKVCSIGTKTKGMGASSGSTMAAFLVAQCPACASLGALFLPVSVMGAITQFSWLINLGTILLLIFTLRYLGAFKKTV